MDPEHYCPSTRRIAKVHCWSREGGMVKLLVVPKTENTFYLRHHQLLMSMAFSQHSIKKKRKKRRRRYGCAIILYVFCCHLNSCSHNSFYMVNGLLHTPYYRYSQCHYSYLEVKEFHHNII